MCHRLLLVVFAVGFVVTSAATISDHRMVRSASALDALLTEFLESSDDTKLPSSTGSQHGDTDYDLHYDQRQSGSENYRLNVDGVMMAVPAASETTISSLGALATNYLMDLAAATSELDAEDEEDAEDEATGEEGGVDVVEELVEEEQQQQQHHTPVGIEHSITAEAAPYKYADNSRLLSAAGIKSAASAVLKKPKKTTGSFVQESRTHPRNGPAKKRNKYTSSLNHA